MARMTGGEAVVRSLLAHGVDTVFGLPGVQLDHLFNALYDHRNEIRVIHTRHEQGAAYMAFGYAQSTGRIGAFAVVPGPGVLNAMAALSTAWACSAPVLCLTGQIPSALIERGTGQLHEIPGQLRTVGSLCKYAARIGHPSQAPALVAEAVRQLRSGRPRPVALETPLDVLALAAEVAPGAPGEALAPPPPDPETVEGAARLLGAAEKPMIVAGNGANEAGAEIRALAEALRAPVVLQRNALGLIDTRDPLVVSGLAAHKLWAETDAVLAIGTRLQPQLLSWGTAGLKIVRLDIDPAEINRVARPAVGIVADAREGAAALYAALGRHNRARPSRVDELAAARGAAESDLEAVAPQVAYLRAIREAVPEDGITVFDLTQVGYVSRYAFPVTGPRRYIDPGFQGTLGFGFATALGVKVANPDKAVVSLSGDGGFMYTVQELSTAVQQGLGVVAVVFNDGAYGNVQRMQIEDHGGRVIASDLANPDFVRLAESFGAQGLRASTPEELGRAIRSALDTPGPTLIDAPVGVFPSPWGLMNLPRVRR